MSPLQGHQHSGRIALVALRQVALAMSMSIAAYIIQGVSPCSFQKHFAPVI